MASSWNNSWGTAWGVSWGSLAPVPPPPQPSTPSTRDQRGGSSGGGGGSFGQYGQGRMQSRGTPLDKRLSFDRFREAEQQRDIELEREREKEKPADKKRPPKRRIPIAKPVKRAPPRVFECVIAGLARIDGGVKFQCSAASVSEMPPFVAVSQPHGMMKMAYIDARRVKIDDELWMRTLALNGDW